MSAGSVRAAGQLIESGTIIWAAGVQASSLARQLSVPVDAVGRVKVLPDLSIPGDPNIFVLGDCATLEGADGRPLPGLAQVALRQGPLVADNIVATIKDLPRKPFRYVDRINMATVGRMSGIAEIGRVRLAGPLGWFAWLLVHLVLLISFRSRVLVLIQWVWAYLTFERGARLIAGRPGPNFDKTSSTPD